MAEGEALNMPPYLSIENEADRGLIARIFAGQLFLRLSRRCAYFCYLYLGEFGSAMPGPRWRFLSKNIKSVPYVLRACNPLKILCSVIEFVAVFMVDVRAIKPATRKTKRNHSMHSARYVFAGNRGVNGAVSIGVYRARKASFSSRVPHHAVIAYFKRTAPFWINGPFLAAFHDSQLSLKELTHAMV